MEKPQGSESHDAELSHEEKIAIGIIARVFKHGKVEVTHTQPDGTQWQETVELSQFAEEPDPPQQ